SAGGGTDNRWGYLSFAYELEMDTLSLQWRSLKALYKADPARARELFSQIPPPRLEPLTCNDALTYDVSPFYEALAAMSKDQPVDYVEPYVRRISSPVQIGPAIQLILQRKASPHDLERLATAFTLALGQVEHDP